MKIRETINNILDECLRITYSNDHLNLWSKNISLNFTLPFIILINKYILNLKTYARNSITTDDFKAFASDIDLTIVGPIEKIPQWKKTHKIIKYFFWRIGEWEYYTEDEYEILQKLKTHKYNIIWQKILYLRKYSTYLKYYKQYPSIKYLKSLERSFLKCDKLNGDIIFEGLPLDETNNLLNPPIFSPYLQMEITDYFSANNLYFSNTEKLHSYITIFPDFDENMPINPILIELKLYIAINEFITCLCHERYATLSFEDKANVVSWKNRMIRLIQAKQDFRKSNFNFFNFVEKYKI